MAFYRTGGLIVKSVKPVLTNPCFILPSSVNLQLRHAARKGYREKKAKKKLLAEPTVTEKKELSRIKSKYSKIEKTYNQKKPEPPSDDIFMTDSFNFKKYSLTEAVTLHKEYHHPEVYNNPNALISLKIEINMTGKKGTKFIKPFSGIAPIPHPFVISHKREVLVFCNPEDTELALSCGASVVGGVELMKKIQEGIVQPSLYDYIIAHGNFLPQLTPMRNVLKDRFPKAKTGTLTNDLKSAISRFIHGIEYSCVRIGTPPEFGIIDCYIGRTEMEPHQLEENMKALISDIETNKPPRDGEFISWIWCSSKPSTEEFSIDLSKYITAPAAVDEDAEEEVLSEREQEKQAIQKLRDESEKISMNQ